MKIAFLNIYSGINKRGAESFMHELANRLATKHTVDFYYGGSKEGSEDYAVKEVAMAGVSQPTHTGQTVAKRLFLDKPSLQVLVFTLKVLGQLRTNNYDVLVPTNGFWQLLLCKLIAPFIGAKVLVVGNSGPYWDERFNLYLKPDCFVATTEPTALWAKKVAPWTKVVTIPYAIDPQRFEKAKAVKLDLESPIILCVAAAEPYKRVDYAIRAVTDLKKGSLVHLGTGTQQTQIAALGESLLGQKRFVSLVVPYEKIPSYYKAADVITLPSTAQENSPMTFLEAIAAGKYTVVEDYPRAKWLLGEAGVFVNIADQKEYAQALLESSKSLKSDVQKKLLTRYSWETVLNSYLEILNKW